MTKTSCSDSSYLLDADLVKNRSVQGLRVSLLTLLALQLLLALVVGVSLMLGVSLIYASSHLQIVIALAAIALTSLAYGLLRQGRYVRAGHLLVFSLIACSTASMVAYGSARSAMVMGFAGAIVSAGMALGKKTLITAVVASGVALGALTWVEMSGWLVKPTFKVDLGFWLVHMILLGGIAVSVYTNRQVVLRALRAQHVELKRREQAEDALAISEDRFRRIFRNSPAAIVVQALDGMRVLDVNPAFERLYGYTREEFLGGTDAVLWRHPEDRKAFARQMAAAGRVVNLPLEAVTRSGDSVHILLSTEIEGQAEQRLVVSTITDATAEYQARQAARQSEELFSKALTSAPST